MEAKNFSVALIGVKEYGLPFVEGAFQGDNGLWYKGYFLVDSCSVDCILNKKVLKVAAGALTDGECKMISALGDDVVSCKPAHLNFSVGEAKFEETFYLGETIDFESTMEFSCVIGILGLKFLLRNELAIDFEHLTLRASTIKEDNVSVESCRFLFPMTNSIRMFRVPMVGIVGKDDNVYAFLADTGANVNTITRCVLEEGGFDHKSREKSGQVVAISGTFDVQFENVAFTLMSLGEKEGEPELQSYQRKFQVIEGQDYIFPEDDDKPLVGGMISAPFMCREGWVLDFSASVIYARKAA